MLCGYCATSQGYALATTDTSKFDLEKGWELRGKKYTIKKISTGELITFENAYRFCRENNLTIGGISGMLFGYSKTSQGYCLPETEIEPLRTYQITNPSGETVQFNDAEKFQKDHGISLQAMMHRGAKSNRQGWTNLFVFREGRINRWPGSKSRSTPTASDHNST